MTTDLVTGAFGYTGSRIAERLLAVGRQVATLTRRPPGGHPLDGRVQRRPYDFTAPTLEQSLRGVDTLYVTYWMRFPRGGATWDATVHNVARLGFAARKAGVRRLVFVSVTNARHDSSTAYFRAKAAAEEVVRLNARDQLSVAIVRPTLLYGPDDILVNNMAWTLRRLPLFGVPADGRYLVQPVHVDDVAALCVRLGGSDDDVDMAAAGPERLSFNDMVGIVRAAVRSRALVIQLPAPLVWAATRLIGLAVRDIVLTRDEIRELTESLLVAPDGTETCPTRFSDWIAQHADEIGRRWSSELSRNFRLR